MELMSYYVVILLSMSIGVSGSSGLMEFKYPHISLSLYDPLIQRLICRDGGRRIPEAVRLVTGLLKNMKCVENQVDDKFRPLLHKCWHSAAGIEYPTTKKEWTDFYCNNKTPWMLKNLAEHCFLSNWKKKVNEDDFDSLTEECLNFPLLEPYDKEGIESEAKSDDDDDDDDDASDDKQGGESTSDGKCKVVKITEDTDKDFCEVKLAMEKKMKRICQGNDSRLLKEEIHDQKCIERIHPADNEIAKFCWRAVHRTQYPNTDQQWKEAVCNTTHRYGKQRIMMDCILYRLGRSNDTVYKTIKSTCYRMLSYYPNEDRRYRHRFMLDDEEYDELIQQGDGYEKLCEEERPATRKKFFQKHQLKCLADNIKTRIGQKVLKYCFSKLVARAFNLEGTAGARNRTDIPSTDRGWISLSCDSGKTLRSLKSGKEIVTCFSNLIILAENSDFDDDLPVYEEKKLLDQCYRDSVELDGKTA